MTPKEKARELVDNYAKLYYDLEYDYYDDRDKQCALIAVEEVRSFHDKLFFATKGSLFDKYLDNVKKEIEKL